VSREEHREPDWVSRLRLSVTDEPDGEPTGTAQPSVTPAAEPDDEPDRPEPRGLPVRWCALLAVLALGLAATGGSYLNARRSRTVTNTVVGYRQPRDVFTGCPRGDVCQPLPSSDAVLADLRPPELAGATLLASSVLIDSDTSATIRSIQLLTSDGLTLTVTGQCIIGGSPVPGRATEPSLAADGSIVLALVRPGTAPGCSVALVARVPNGRPVPGTLLRRLADELPQRLVGG